MDISEIEKACQEIPNAAFTARSMLLVCNEIRRLEAIIEELTKLVEDIANRPLGELRDAISADRRAKTKPIISLVPPLKDGVN